MIWLMYLVHVFGLVAQARQGKSPRGLQHRASSLTSTLPSSSSVPYANGTRQVEVVAQLVFASQELGDEQHFSQTPEIKAESTSAAGSGRDSNRDDAHAEVGFLVNRTNSFDAEMIFARSDSLL